MKLKQICTAAVLGAGALTIAPAAAFGSLIAPVSTKNLVVERLARDTGLPPAEVVATLGDNYHLIAAQYNAHPSKRGYLARITRRAHEQHLQARMAHPHRQAKPRNVVSGQPRIVASGQQR